MQTSRIHLIDSTSGTRFPAAPSGTVLRTSEDAGWRGIVVELQRIAPDALPEHYIEEHRLTIHVGAPTRFEYKANGQWRQVVLKPGDVCLQPHGAYNAPRWHDEMAFLAVALDPAFTARVFADDLTPERIGFQEQRGLSDSAIARFAQHFYRELETPTFGGPLYGESLAVAFATHLLEAHGTGEPLPATPRGRMGSASLGRVLERVYDGLLTDGDAGLSLEELAAEAYVSPFHFSRLFKSTVGLSPHQFVLRARIERAQQLIQAAPSKRLTEVGLEAGFYDQAHFSRVFKRVTGTSPRQYARAVRG